MPKDASLTAAAVTTGPLPASRKVYVAGGFRIAQASALVDVYDPGANTDRTIQVGQPVGTVVPRRSGGVMLAVKAQAYLFEAANARHEHDHQQDQSEDVKSRREVQ